MRTSRVEHARAMRHTCMQLARTADVSEQYIFVHFAKEWHRRMMSAQLMERAIVACEAAYSAEREDTQERVAA